MLLMKIIIDKLIRSKRKTISLEIRKDGSLYVRAPHIAPYREIIKIINNKADWIIAKKKESLLAASQKREKQFIDGEEFLFVGRKYKLQLIDNLGGLQFDGTTFKLDPEFISYGVEVFAAWYKQNAMAVFMPRAEYFSELSGLVFKNIRITGARKRWGSCSSAGNINFSWHLALAPVHIIDYVIAHEIAHLKHHNHSQRFWALVETMVPDYKIHRKWLREHGHLLDMQ